MSWDKSNEAHRFLWIFVRGVHFDYAIRNGEMETFEKGGDWSNDFIIGAYGAGQDIRNQKAQIFALKFNAWLLGNFDVEYENGVKANEAIEELAKAFSQPQSLLKSVAETVDNKYNFPSER